MPVPNPEAMRLIHAYAEFEGPLLPDWVHALMIATERIQPPSKRARQEDDDQEDDDQEAPESPADLPPEPTGNTDDSACEEEKQDDDEKVDDDEKEEDDEKEDLKQEEVPGPDVAPNAPRSSHADQSQNDHQKEQRILFAHAARSIFGWKPVIKSPHWPNRLLAGVVLRNEKVLLGLCGFNEVLHRQEPPAARSHLMVAVQRGTGKWEPEHLPNYYEQQVNWTEWSRFQKDFGLGCGLPQQSWSWERKKSRYRALTETMHTFWQKNVLDKKLERTRTCLVFWCKAGRHRSYGLLIAFLMWAGHLHDPQLWASLIAPLRNTNMEEEDGRQVELLHAHEMTATDRNKGNVPFATVLAEFAHFLNRDYPAHAWCSTP